MAEFNDTLAAELQRELQRTGHRIVFAESCTAGLIAATLGRIPGISEWLAGSAVVYQLTTKTAWLNIDAALLDKPGPVSQVVSEQMAAGVLELTPHATIAASVTGHLGPDAPPELDGIAWSTVVIRTIGQPAIVSRHLQLDTATPSQLVKHDDVEKRRSRQMAAVRLVLEFCVETLAAQS